MDADDRRRELAAYMRACRAAVSPYDVGLPATARRRTPGLRREEVAALSGVGVTWYTWLEQGREITATAQVIDALARALRLDEAAHAHLRALADLSTVSGDLRHPSADRLRRILHELEPNPACALDVTFGYQAWNNSYAALYDPSRLPSNRGNLMIAFFTDPSIRALVANWELRARALVAQFRGRAGRHAGDERFQAIVDTLRRESLEFRTWWASYQVADFSYRQHVIRHPHFGELTLEISQLVLADQPDITIVLQTPVNAPGRDALRASPLERKQDPGRACSWQ